jgi:hypothetical protein
MERDWYCHCCGKLNAATQEDDPKCKVCARPAAYSKSHPDSKAFSMLTTYSTNRRLLPIVPFLPFSAVKEYHPFHGVRMPSMNPCHVPALLSKEADREAMDEALFRPLHLAAVAGNDDIVSALIKEKCWIDVRTKVRRLDPREVSHDGGRTQAAGTSSGLFTASPSHA